jgi:hypothetical protein
MIFVRDKGRMCNNILQYGHLYAWGREHGRQTMSMRFAYKYPYFRICRTAHHNFLTYVFAKYAAKWRLIPTVAFDVEGSSEEQEQEMLNRRLIVAEGWYARWYDLFAKYKQEIISLFAFNETTKAGVDRLLAGMPRADIRLGVHIRRGDYATWQGGRYCYDDAQYLSFIGQFIALHPGKRVQVFICGNDPQLDRSLYRQALPEGCVCFPQGNPGEDLYLLSQCDWLIGAPSTFTLVASMYRDLPLHWILDAGQPLTPKSFGRFDSLFRHII